ncbi:MAG: type II secretion system F family protein [Firmicutes bacterium]|nr:type II secretion system F family protein [Bacillota bacterium]
MLAKLAPQTIMLVTLFFAFGCVCSLVMSLGGRRQRRVKTDLDRLDSWFQNGAEAPVTIDAARERLSLPVRERLIRPALKRIARLFYRWTPAQNETDLPQKLLQAGSPGGLNARDFAALKYGLTFILGIVAAQVSTYLTPNISTRFMIAAAFGIIGFLLPTFILRYLVRSRQEDVVKRLPDSLDLMLVSIEAGMGFDGALQKVADKSRSVLGQEFSRLLNEIRMGKPRREAMRSMADRIGTEEVSGLVGAVIQSESLGVGISGVLRQQAALLRQRRRQKAEEKAMKAPIKMLIPLVLFIFPTIFIVLLGPAAIRMIMMFAS